MTSLFFVSSISSWGPNLIRSQKIWETVESDRSVSLGIEQGGKGGEWFLMDIQLFTDY